MTETSDEAECKHQMPRKWCATCNRPIKAMMPRRAPVMRSPEETSRRSLAAAAPTPVRYGASGSYVVVRTSKSNAREDPSFDALDEKTLFVHIDGHPFVWAIAKILERAPNLQVLEVIPPMLCKIGKQHRALCEARCVEVRTGHFRPELAWDGECRTPWYVEHRAFLLEKSSEEQKAKFAELRTLGFEDAEVTARYFCLDGQQYVSQQKVAEEFGIWGNSLVSRKILSVLAYLNPQLQVGQDAVRFALGYAERVKKIRATIAETRWKEDLVAELGIKDLPAGLPMSRLHVFKQLVLLRKRGALEVQNQNRDETQNQNRLRAVTLRFGLDEEPGRYRLLHEVGEIMGIGRERVRQLESDALEDLGLETDEEPDDSEIARLLTENDGNAAAVARHLGLNEKAVQRARQRIQNSASTTGGGPGVAGTTKAETTGDST